jgi:hypothetical protein
VRRETETVTSSASATIPDRRRSVSRCAASGKRD